MKTSFRFWFVLLSWLVMVGAARAQGSAFTYQGRLNSGANAATGLFDLTFTLFNVAGGAGQVGTPFTNSLTPVTNGLFNVTLDFGNQFPGANRWLEIAVRTNGAGAFTTLTPRQRVTATPYAITASNISGLLPATSLAGTYSSVVTLNNAGNSFSGNGAGLTSLNANNLASGTVPDARLAANIARTNQVWLLAGNLGTAAGTDFVGTRDNQALELKVNSSRALRLEPNAAGAPNVIGGSIFNTAGAGTVGATISGGGATNYLGVPYTNRADGNLSSIGGGGGNFIASSAEFARVGGGKQNQVFGGANATLGGGIQNSIHKANATIGGGHGNTIEGPAATIGGGGSNRVTTTADYATVGGGSNNLAGAVFASVGGGRDNVADAPHAQVGGGRFNTALGDSATVAGGGYNSSDGAFATIGGGDSNDSISNSATVGGGRLNMSSGDAATVGGGSLNLSSAAYATVGGGIFNVSSSNSTTVAGGAQNTSSGDAATVGGGFHNESSGHRSVVAGGEQNISSAIYTAVGGGERNISTNSYATVGGGGYNNSGGYAGTVGGGVDNTNSSFYATVGGGQYNRSDGFGATVSGGGFNSSSGDSATVPGGYRNSASGPFSFAAGLRAKANHPGAFVWGDSQNADVISTADNQFIIRAGGGVGIGATNLAGALTLRAPAGVPPNGMSGTDNALVLGLHATNSYKWIQSYGGSLILNPLGNNVGVGLTNPLSALHVNGTVTATSFNPPSDRNLKENFTGVSPREMLEKVSALKITRWNFKGDDATPHLGPMAQDFHAAFQLGTDDRHIATVDADGVALAAIQGLNEKVESGKQQAEVRLGKLEEENAQLKRELGQLKELLCALAQNVKGEAR